jgi:hypothetical protein
LNQRKNRAIFGRDKTVHHGRSGHSVRRARVGRVVHNILIVRSVPLVKVRTIARNKWNVRHSPSIRNVRVVTRDRIARSMRIAHNGPAGMAAINGRIDIRTFRNARGGKEDRIVPSKEIVHNGLLIAEGKDNSQIVRKGRVARADSIVQNSPTVRSVHGARIVRSIRIVHRVRVVKADLIVRNGLIARSVRRVKAGSGRSARGVRAGGGKFFTGRGQEGCAFEHAAEIFFAGKLMLAIGELEV